MNTESEMYKFVATINKARQAAQAWNYDYVERYVLDDLFAYSFGDMLVVTTNHDRNISIQLPYLPYEPGQEVCNVFDANDCYTVDWEGMKITMQSMPNIYLPKDHSFFESAEQIKDGPKIETN
jgi:hypothetical protein